jgi:hypothetical protein
LRAPGDDDKLAERRAGFRGSTRLDSPRKKRHRGSRDQTRGFSMTIRHEVGGPTPIGRHLAAAVFVAFGLCLFSSDIADAGEPSSRPFRLAPASDLALSDPADRVPSPCTGFQVLLPEQQAAECPRVAATDEPAAIERAEVHDPSPPLEHWAYRAAPYLIPVGVAVGGLENSLTDSPLRSFRFVNEGYFGASTYAGGADKASHFVDYTIVSREIAYVYEKLGYSERTSTLLGLGMGFLGGLANEIGDGFDQYGFSFQDLAMDSAGAITSTLLLATGTQDLVGFRNGFLVPKSKATCCESVGGGLLLPLCLLAFEGSPWLMPGAALCVVQASLVIRFMILRLPHASR